MSSKIRILVKTRFAVARRATLEALRASRRHFGQRIEEATEEAVLVVNFQGQLLRANPQAVALLGYSDETELKNRSAYGLVQPDERERFRSLLASTVAAEFSRNQQCRLVRKSGQSFPVEINGGCLAGRDGGAPVLVFAVREISLHGAPS